MQSKTFSMMAALPAVVLLLAGAAIPAVGQAVDVRLPAVSANAGETIQIPVLVDDLTGKGITTFYLKIAFDSDVLQFNKSILANTLSDVEGAGKFDGKNTPGEFTVAYAAPATRPLSGEGTLILLEATVLAEGSTELPFLEMQFNDDNVPSNTTDGFFSTDALSFSDVSLSFTASSSLIRTGDGFNVTALIVNDGPDTASDVETVVILPGEVSFESASNGCMYEDGSVTCQVATLSPSASSEHTLTLTAPGTAQLLDVSASVSSASFDSDLTDNSGSISLSVESDLDGVSDEIESQVPNLNGDGSGDGNGDGIPDSDQDHVASLPNATDGNYVTVVAAEDASLRGVSFSQTPPPGAPSSVEFPDGFLNFELHAGVGAATTITIYSTKVPNTYVKFGPTADNPSDHLYEFLYDGTTGAEIFEDRVVIHFVDGERGDADLTANGTIVDPGGIAFSNNQAPVAQNDAYAAEEDETLVVALAQGVLTNDSDPNDDDLHVSLVSDVEYGVLSLESDGSFTYAPDENFNGVDSFTYSASDGLLADEAVVTISVDAVNDAPRASVIESPSADASVTIGGETGADAADGNDELLTITWTESDDPEGDDVSYVLVVAEDADFTNVLAEYDVTAEFSYGLSVAEAAAWFDAAHGSAELGATTTVYMRIVTSDGNAETAGESTALVLSRGTITSIDRPEMPDTFALRGNYPNPFNPSTNISFDVPRHANVSVDVFDNLGRRVYRVPARAVAAGSGRSIAIDASTLPSGAYVYRIVAEMGPSTEVASGVMTLMK